MKTNEITIGDWVYNTHTQKNERVAEIGSGLVMLNYNDLYEYNEIEPIPLTPEILEKNGFVNKKGRFMQKGNFDDPPLIMWHLVDEEILRHPKSQLEIHHGAKSTHVSLVCIYVHELQHALRLCGLGELADNFKVTEGGEK